MNKVISNMNVNEFNTIRKLKEVIEIYGNDEQKRVLSKEILSMDEEIFLTHFNNSVKKMDELTNKKIEEIMVEFKSMTDYLATMRAVTSIVEKHIKGAGVKTMEELEDFFSASHHGLFGSCLIDELWYNKK